jgi:thymidylate kinase
MNYSLPLSNVLAGYLEEIQKKIELSYDPENFEIFVDSEKKDLPDICKFISEAARKRSITIRTRLASSSLKVLVFDLIANNKERKFLFLNIGKKTDKKLSVSPKAGLKQKISEFIFYKLFFIHAHRPNFFAMLGADGAGKTTAGENTEKIFSQLPLDFSFFHHIWEWEKELYEEDEKGNLQRKPEKETKVSFKRKILKAIWKFVPASIKEIWGALGFELDYCVKVSRLIGDKFFDGQTMLVDRYAYDQAVKMMQEGETKTQRIISKIFATKILRKPLLALILTDEPEVIYGRKQELTVEQIDSYQKNVLNLCSDYQIPFKEISARGKSPEEAAREIAKSILDAMGDEVFSAVNHWKLKHNVK